MSLTRIHITVTVSLAILFGATTSAKGTAGGDHPIKTPNISILKLKVGEPFIAARARIIGQGWMPIRMHSSDSYEYDGAEKRLAVRGFLEVDSCSIDAGANCTLYYGKGDICLRLDTIGEQVDDMRVTRWLKECPTRTDNH